MAIRTTETVRGDALMNSYTKPNVNLPISLHDAFVSAMQIIPASDGKHDGVVTFTLENGFVNLFQKDGTVDPFLKGGCQTGKASVKFFGIDFDFSHVYYCKDNQRREVSFEELANDLINNPFNILDETYGYNLSKIDGYMTTVNAWHEVEIEIVHFNETIYEWVD